MVNSQHDRVDTKELLQTARDWLADDHWSAGIGDVGMHYETTCAVGAIATAAGFDVKRLMRGNGARSRANTMRITAAPREGGEIFAMFTAIEEEFGLDVWQMNKIQEINDSDEFINVTTGEAKLEARRAAIRGYVATLD